MTTKITMIAINAIQICDGTESEITGYREDGSPITKLVIRRYEPGEQFEVGEFDATRFIDLGAATTDLTYNAPEPVNVRD